MIKLKHLTVAVLTTSMLAGVSANSAQAAQFDFSYSGSGVNTSGVLTTTNTPDSNGYLTITDISGQRNGSPITALLPPGSFPGDFPPNGVPNDNLFLPTAPFLDFNGFSYLVGSQPENVFYYQTTGGYAETSDVMGDPSNYRLLNNFTVTAVPEHNSPLLDTLTIGVLGAGYLAKRRLKKSEGATTIS